MLRLECLRAVYSDLEKCLVVTIMGATAAELHSLGFGIVSTGSKSSCL
jgi:sulfopyruvate decarboxylase subunit beta